MDAARESGFRGRQGTRFPPGCGSARNRRGPLDSAAFGLGLQGERRPKVGEHLDPFWTPGKERGKRKWLRELVGPPRFELGTSSTPRKRATRLRYGPIDFSYCSGNMHRNPVCRVRWFAADRLTRLSLRSSKRALEGRKEGPRHPFSWRYYLCRAPFARQAANQASSRPPELRHAGSGFGQPCRRKHRLRPSFPENALSDMLSQSRAQLEPVAGTPAGEPYVARFRMPIDNQMPVGAVCVLTDPRFDERRRSEPRETARQEFARSLNTFLGRPAIPVGRIEHLASRVVGDLDSPLSDAGGNRRTSARRNRSKPESFPLRTLGRPPGSRSNILPGVSSEWSLRANPETAFPAKARTQIHSGWLKDDRRPTNRCALTPRSGSAPVSPRVPERFLLLAETARRRRDRRGGHAGTRRPVRNTAFGHLRS